VIQNLVKHSPVKLTSLTSGVPVWFASVCQRWFTNDPELRRWQREAINYTCLVIICINPLLSFINFWLSYKIYGITSLIALCVLVLNKQQFFNTARLLFLAGLYGIIFLHSAISSNAMMQIGLISISLLITIALFSKEELSWILVCLGSLLTVFTILQLAAPAFPQNRAAENLFGFAFFTNAFCTLLSVVLAIYYLVSIYGKSEKSLRILVQELQIRESEIRTQNEELRRLYDNLLVSQEELIKSETFLNTIIDNLPVMLFVKNAQDNTFVRLNKTGEKMLNYSEADVLHKCSSALFPAAKARLFSETDQQVLREKATVQYEEKLVNLNHQTYFITTKKVPIYNAKGEITHILGISEDITQRKKAEDQLKQTLEELKTRNHELDNYVYRVSHDLRAPLCSISGLTQLAQQETDAGMMQQYLQLIAQSVRKSDTFIQSILDHSKQLNSEIQVKPIDFRGIIDTCLEEYQHLTEMKGFDVKVNLRGTEVFYSDEFRMKLILRNLIANAVKFVALQVPAPRLRFTIEVSADRACITAEDNGIGIAKEHQEKIFDMFFRGTEKSDGNGLGLYIVKQSIDKLNGTIQVDSTEGKGTTFRINIPAIRA
jgi:PAS domain S-box-containing protein